LTLIFANYCVSGLSESVGLKAAFRVPLKAALLRAILIHNFPGADSI